MILPSVRALTIMTMIYKLSNGLLIPPVLYATQEIKIIMAQVSMASFQWVSSLNNLEYLNEMINEANVIIAKMSPHSLVITAEGATK